MYCLLSRCSSPPGCRSVTWLLCLSVRTRHEALQKLAIFFQQSKDEFDDVPDGGGATPTKYSIHPLFHNISVLQCFLNLKTFFPLFSPSPSVWCKVLNHQVSLLSSIISMTSLLSPLMSISLIMVELRRGYLQITFKFKTVSTLVGVSSVMENHFYLKTQRLTVCM